jgi:Transposase DDE domain
MEDELWGALYPVVVEEDRRRARLARVRYNDAIILLVALWAVLHDRPIGWACRASNWPGGEPPAPWVALPTASTMSDRLWTASAQLLLEQVLLRLLGACAAWGFCLTRRIDSKPLPVGGFSKDRDARWGHATAGGKYKGYRLFGCWGRSPGVVPEAFVLGPMNESDQAGAIELIDQLTRLYDGGAAGGYLLADSPHDTNPLHAHAAAHGFQLVAPRKQPGKGLGHREHAPARLRSLALLEGPADLDPFGPALYACRGQVERDYGNLGSFGGGLQPLPSFVRRPHRVALWAAGKLIINGLRICLKHGLKV